MKLAFTTLGCPAWDLVTIVSNAVAYGFDGVDFRGYLGELDIFKLPEFSTDLHHTAARFTEAGLEVPCFSSSVRAFCTTEEELKSATQEIKSYSQICRAFGAPFIRIFGGSIGNTSRTEAIDIMADNLTHLLAIAQEYDVQLLIETHDDWMDSRHLKAVIEQVNMPSLGVLWDTHHPYRMEREAPETTWDHLGPWICNTHWKDSYVTDDSGGYQLCLIGDGDLPLPDIHHVLQSHGYTGYLTLEWEKIWHPEIAEAEVAFPGFIQYMRNLMK